MTDHLSPVDPGASLRLEGDLTISHAAEFKPRLLEALTGPLAVDLSGVTAIDGAGMQLLAMLDREAARRGLRIDWNAPSRAARAAFDRLRIDSPRGLSTPTGTAGGTAA